ncbi:hypothetical protein [Chryseolinea sp. H1M3-3]|uniref:hypothetical protein n=1 Tax=Chryseolinea sp. H1M3-3 TaxID=3034144 RepID=UPI0023EAEC1F|nr:hypothetical protein [Chryseolinea sp. H1M3-3]
MKKIVTLMLALMFFKQVSGQEVKVDYFVRLPHVVNYNFTNETASYSPIISSGLTIKMGNYFADVGAYIDEGDSYGYYTYLGSPVYSKAIDQQWTFVTNWFSEILFFPQQAELPDSWTYTFGISPVLVRPISFSTFAIALTVGAGFNEHTTSVNTRLIINYSIPLIK